MDFETLISDYPRMKYAYDQRAWVAMADRELPELEALASKHQQDAAQDFRNWSEAGIDEQIKWSSLQSFVHSRYADARALLFRCVEYKAMRQANLPILDPTDFGGYSRSK